MTFEICVFSGIPISAICAADRRIILQKMQLRNTLAEYFGYVIAQRRKLVNDIELPEGEEYAEYVSRLMEK